MNTKNQYLAWIVTLILLSPVSALAVDNITDSVVKIFTSSNRPDYRRPWQTKGTQTFTGSGCIIEGKRILTNAHVVSDHTFIQVKRYGDPKKYIATVEAIGHECDLAVLSVKNDLFFNDIEPLQFGSLPNLRDSITVIGYPQGGNKLSTTVGVISRIELIPYSLSSRRLLAVQIDAAINSGNSGGPVVQDGNLIGIAMQSFTRGQNIGYIIPMPIIRHFFDDINDGKFDGFPRLGIGFDGTENSALREYYKIGSLDGGVLISKVWPFSPADAYLREGDVLLELDGIPIGEDGTFKFRDDERLSMDYLITKKQVNDEIKINLMRDGVIMQLTIPLTPVTSLVPRPYHFKTPPYYIYGGLVFTVLSSDLLRSWGRWWWEKAPLDLNYYLLGKGRVNEERRKEIVVLLSTLPDDINIGYHDFGKTIVTDINGKSFDSFMEFILLLDTSKKNEEYTIIQTERKSRIILNNENIDRIDEDIMKRNSIPSRCSSDVCGWLDR